MTALSDFKIREHQRKVLDQIDLSGFNSKQKQLVEQMLIQGATSFPVGDSDIRNVTSISMEIKLSDKAPVQLTDNYHSVPF